MPHSQKSSGNITPTQALVVVFILLCAAGYEFLQKANGVSAPLTAGSPTEAVLTTIGTPTPTGGEAGPTPTGVTGKTTVGALAFGKFDYFLLALSWAPDYCATNGTNDAQECAIGKKLGFVLHGLWPQNNQGYPSNCSTVKLPQAVQAQFAGLYPNDGLFTHEWDKHGTCSGVSPAQYLAFTQQIKQSVHIPAAYQSPAKPFRTSAAELKNDFSATNPGFSADGFEPNCEGTGRYLQEVYACFSKEGQPVACSAEVHKTALKSCQAADFLVRNIR